MPQTIDRPSLLHKGEQLIAAARAAGADAADAVVIRTLSENVAVRQGRLERAEHADGLNAALRVFVGGRQASVSIAGEADATSLAARALAMARAAPPDPYAGLADPALLCTDFPALDLCDGRSPSTEALTERAKAAEEAALGVQGVTQSAGASASWSHSAFALVTSQGFAGAYEMSRHAHAVTAIAGSGTAMQRDYEASAGVHLEDLEDPVAIGRQAGLRAVRRLHPRRLPTQSATIVHEPRAARSLLGAFLGAISGAAIARGTSFLKERMGQRVFSSEILITDDPLQKRGLAARPFDGEGVAASALALVEKGILRHWLLDSASARELNLPTNGRAGRGLGAPGPSSTNVCLHPGESDPKSLMRAIGTGLYITDFIGHGANLVTGNYSRGASGFWIENGECAYPVAEITVAGKLDEMFERLIAARDLDTRFALSVPTLVIEGMTIAGT